MTSVTPKIAVRKSRCLESSITGVKIWQGLVKGRYKTVSVFVRSQCPKSLSFSTI